MKLAGIAYHVPVRGLMENLEQENTSIIDVFAGRNVMRKFFILGVQKFSKEY